MNRLTIFVCLIGITLSCNPRNSGPLGKFTNLSFVLTGYTVNGQSRPISDVPERAFLGTQQDADSIYFTFKDDNKKVSIFQRFTFENFDVNKDRDVGYYYLKSSDNLYCRALLGWNDPKYMPTKLEIGNLMKNSYQSRADTVRYYYSPL